MARQVGSLAGEMEYQWLGQHAQVLPDVGHETDVRVAPLRESSSPLRLHLPHKDLGRRLQLRAPQPGIIHIKSALRVFTSAHVQP